LKNWKKKDENKKKRERRERKGIRYPQIDTVKT
jgi:hypothetical protein